MDKLTDRCLAQLDSLIQLYEENECHGDRGGYLADNVLSEFITAALAAADRIAGHTSAYAEQIRSVLAVYKGSHNTPVAYCALGALKALRRDVESGFLTTLRELSHGEVFGDFLEMAEYLLSEGYKDAAAVLGGGVIESHLRQLCPKLGIDLEYEVNGDLRAKKAGRLNADLAKANAYDGLDQKNVIAWLDLRNKAAHAKYGDYSKEQVALLLSGVRDFLTRHRA